MISQEPMRPQGPKALQAMGREEIQCDRTTKRNSVRRITGIDRHFRHIKSSCKRLDPTEQPRYLKSTIKGKWSEPIPRVRRRSITWRSVE